MIENQKGVSSSWAISWCPALLFPILSPLERGAPVGSMFRSALFVLIGVALLNFLASIALLRSTGVVSNTRRGHSPPTPEENFERNALLVREHIEKARRLKSAGRRRRRGRVADQGLPTPLRERRTDVIITTSPKSGTTWMQWIVHMLRTNATDTAFSEIGEVVPWIDHADELGQNLNEEQYAGSSTSAKNSNERKKLPFRAFKTHMISGNAKWLRGAEEPVGKKIVVLRDPMDSAVSFYNFALETHNAAPGSVAQRFFFEESSIGSQLNAAAFFAPLVDLWERSRSSRSRNRILLVFYEDMKADLRGTVEQVAEFLSSGVPELVDYRAFDLVDRVVQRASFAWMKDHSALFDDHFAWKAMVLPALSTSGVGMQPPDKVVDGRVGDGQRRLIPEARQLLIRQWESARPGNCANYDKLRRKYGRFGVFSGPRFG